MQSVHVEAETGAAGNGKIASRGERLNFHGKGALTVHGHDHGRAAQGGVARAEEKGGRVFHEFQTLARHAEDEQFLIGAEAVLQHPEHAEHFPPVAFQGNDRVHEMFQKSRSGKGAVLGDVPHQHQRGARTAAALHKFRGHGAHLTHVAGQAFGVVGSERLHGVHDHEGRGRVGIFKHGKKIFHPAGGHGKKVVVQHVETFRAAAYLRQ